MCQSWRESGNTAHTEAELTTEEQGEKAEAIECLLTDDVAYFLVVSGPKQTRSASTDCQPGAQIMGIQIPARIDR